MFGIGGRENVRGALELIVLGADGAVLRGESLLAKGKEDAEYCEGYVER